MTWVRFLHSLQGWSGIVSATEVVLDIHVFLREITIVYNLDSNRCSTRACLHTWCSLEA